MGNKKHNAQLAKLKLKKKKTKKNNTKYTKNRIHQDNICFITSKIIQTIYKAFGVPNTND